jgi:hypothetical protein
MLTNATLLLQVATFLQDQVTCQHAAATIAAALSRAAAAEAASTRTFCSCASTRKLLKLLQPLSCGMRAAIFATLAEHAMAALPVALTVEAVLAQVAQGELRISAGLAGTAEHAKAVAETLQGDLSLCAVTICGAHGCSTGPAAQP